MCRLVLFAEDVAHEHTLRALIARLALEAGVKVEVVGLSVRGGHGPMLRELKQYVIELTRGKRPLPDLLVVVRDANCRGLRACQAELKEALQGYMGPSVCAIPDPHIERWLLLDSAAFKTVFERGCSAPDQKCGRGRYKELLLEAIRAAEVEPLLGGPEFAIDIINAMNLDRMSLEPDLGPVIRELRQHIDRWVP